MSFCDLAISAAGQTICELASVGTPTIGVKVAENQNYMFKQWKASGFLIDETYLNSEIRYNLRVKSAKIGQSLIDCKAVKRIVENVLC